VEIRGIIKLRVDNLNQVSLRDVKKGERTEFSDHIILKEITYDKRYLGVADTGNKILLCVLK